MVSIRVFYVTQVKFFCRVTSEVFWHYRFCLKMAVKFNRYCKICISSTGRGDHYGSRIFRDCWPLLPRLSLFSTTKTYISQIVPVYSYQRQQCGCSLGWIRNTLLKNTKRTDRKWLYRLSSLPIIWIFTSKWSGCTATTSMISQLSRTRFQSIHRGLSHLSCSGSTRTMMSPSNILTEHLREISKMK